MTSQLSLPVSFGEAADKITILQIKQERITDAVKRSNVDKELAEVSQIFFAKVSASPRFNSLFAQLKQVNETLWELEDSIRDLERRSDFGMEFVRIARLIYHTNDNRARIKREVDVLLNSPLVEEKSYIEHPSRGE